MNRNIKLIALRTVIPCEFNEINTEIGQIITGRNEIVEKNWIYLMDAITADVHLIPSKSYQIQTKFCNILPHNFIDAI